MKKIYLFSTSSHPDAISINSLDITFFKPDINFSLYDYLIITSKQTVKALKQYPLEKYIDKKALCVSDKTAQAFKDIGGDVLKVGKGYADDLGNTVKKYPKTTKWLYLRAKEVASSFVEVLKKEKYSIDEVIIYESKCAKGIVSVNIENDSVLIFTSPSSVKCFLEHNKIDKNNNVIVIGDTTAKALPSNVKYVLSKDKTIESCMELAKLYY
jgi:uroporphyrinogen-III synthase